MLALELHPFKWNGRWNFKVKVFKKTEPWCPKNEYFVFHWAILLDGPSSLGGRCRVLSILWGPHACSKKPAWAELKLIIIQSWANRPGHWAIPLPMQIHRPCDASVTRNRKHVWNKLQFSDAISSRTHTCCRLAISDSFLIMAESCESSSSLKDLYNRG